MSSYFSNFFGGRSRSAGQQNSKEAILKFHENLQMLEKKQHYLEKQIEEQQNIARSHASSNKRLALIALRRKKAFEQEIEKLYGVMVTLEQQKATLESANLNAELYKSMREGSNALKQLHKSMKAEEVDKVMDQVRENQAIQEDITQLISTPLGDNVGLDDDELLEEFEEIRQEELNDKMLGVGEAPIKKPQKVAIAKPDDTEIGVNEDADLEEEMRQLQAEMAP